MYPLEWDNTPITLTSNTIGYDGIDETGDTEVNVRIEFGKVFTTDDNGNKIMGKGTFFKYGDLTVDFGDNFAYDGTEYTIINVFKHRCEDGQIEYTEVIF